MSESLVIRNSITIQAPKSVVWNLLVNPSETKKYMFGCEALSDWKPGSPLIWKGNYEGNEMVFVKGEIVSIEPEKHLAYTTIDPNSSVEDIPENYLTVTYDLEETDGSTLLNVSQGDYTTVAEGQKRYEDTVAGGGWQPVLESIKKLAEGS